MNKKYQIPQCEVVKLNVGSDVLDGKFGNNSYVPVGKAQGDSGKYDDSVDEMYGKSSVGSALWDE